MTLLAHPFESWVLFLMPLLLDEQGLAALFAQITGVFPKLVLFPLGHPALDENAFRILSYCQ
jgi:hypothetical protein